MDVVKYRASMGGFSFERKNPFAFFQFKKEGEENNEAFSIQAGKKSEPAIFSISEGHGPEAELVAKVVAEHGADAMRDYCGNAPALRERLGIINQTLTERSPQHGALMTLVAKLKDRLHLAHLGDSQAWILRNGKLKRLTLPHRLDTSEPELRRLERLNALLIDSHLVVKSNDPFSSCAQIKSVRFTRALGHKAFAPFISNDPQISSIQIKPEDGYLVLGTNSFWNAATFKQKKRHALEHILASSRSALDASERIESFVARQPREGACTAIIYKLN